MVTRPVIATVCSSLLLATQAAAQLQQFHAPAARPAPAAAPRYSAPPSTVPRFSAPPGSSSPPHFAAPPFVSPPGIAAPAQPAPSSVHVPRRTQQVAAPHAPGRPSPPTGGRAAPPNTPQTSALTRRQSRQLRREETAQIRQLQAQQHQQLRDLRGRTHPDRDALRQLRANAQQIRDLHQQFRDRRLGLQKPPSQAGARRTDGRPRITPDGARQGRFASRFLHQPHPDRWRVDRVPAQIAWRHHHHAGFVAWRGLLFWPYVYTDLFYYPFWPDAYDDAYWPYVYDDFLNSIYWATGNPYSPYPYAAPTAVSVVTETSPGNDCASGDDLTSWPFAKIESVLRPTAEQQALLDELKAADAKAADALKVSCPQAAALTPTGRLEAMLLRLQATSNAVHAVGAPLMKFYNSLTDEQKARFNAIGPDAGPKASTAQIADANACSGREPGLTDLPIESIEDAIRPSDAQQARLNELGKANDHAIAALQAACPDSVPQTPVGRLDAIEKRLGAMIEAARAIKPALEAFYGSLTDDQKSRFNTLGQRRTER
jgi:hypothetical protein